MRILKLIGWIAAALVLLVVIAGGALYFGGSPMLAWAVEHPLSAYVGRQIRVSGPLLVKWGAPTRIIVNDVHIANAPWGSAPEMFSARRLEINLFARTLLHGPPHIPLIALDGAKLLLETSKQGEGNWKFGASAAAPKKRREFPDLNRFLVKDSTLVYRNGKTEATSDLDIATLDVQEPNPQSPVTITAKGAFQKEPLRLDGTVGPIAELRGTQKPYPIRLSGGLDQVALTVDGAVQEPLDVSGADLRLSLNGAKLEEAAATLGVPLPQLPDVRGTTEVTGGDGHWEMKALTIKAGHSDLEGGIIVDATQKVPQIKAQLTSSYIDLADFNGFAGAKPATASGPPKPPDPSGRVLPDTAIAVHKLPGIDADVTFDSTRIKSSGGIPFERISARLLLKGGELTVRPLRFHAADGDVDLNFHFTPFTQDSPPKMHAEIDVRHVDLHRLLGRPTMPPMVRDTAGIVGGFAKVDTTGTSLRDFLGRMNGDAGLFMENGQLSQLLEQIAPIDMLGALGVYVRGDHPTPINCFVSRFDIKGGVATATTFLFDTGQDIVTGKGNINFADETPFLKLSPYNKNLTTISLRTPVDIQGTFAKPDYHLETGNLIARLGAAIGLGVLFPPAALVPLIDVGLGDRNSCGRAYAAQQPPGNPQPKSGSSQAPGKGPTPPPARGAPSH